MRSGRAPGQRRWTTGSRPQRRQKIQPAGLCQGSTRRIPGLQVSQALSPTAFFTLSPLFPPSPAHRSHGVNAVDVVPATDNAAPLCCRFAALRQAGGTRSDVAFPACFSPLRTPCVVLSPEFTCGRWSELWRSLPGNPIETNGSSRILSRHGDGNRDWTIAGDGMLRHD